MKDTEKCLCDVSYLQAFQHHNNSKQTNSKQTENKLKWSSFTRFLEIRFICVFKYHKINFNKISLSCLQIPTDVSENKRLWPKPCTIHVCERGNSYYLLTPWQQRYNLVIGIWSLGRLPVLSQPCSCS